MTDKTPIGRRYQTSIMYDVVGDTTPEELLQAIANNNEFIPDRLLDMRVVCDLIEEPTTISEALMRIRAMQPLRPLTLLYPREVEHRFLETYLP